MKIVVAVTAASGALYARLCLEQLLRAEGMNLGVRFAGKFNLDTCFFVPHLRHAACFLGSYRTGSDNNRCLSFAALK